MYSSSRCDDRGEVCVYAAKPQHMFDFQQFHGGNWQVNNLSLLSNKTVMSYVI